MDGHRVVQRAPAVAPSVWLVLCFVPPSHAAASQIRHRAAPQQPRGPPLAVCPLVHSSRLDGSTRPCPPLPYPSRFPLPLAGTTSATDAAAALRTSLPGQFPPSHVRGLHALCSFVASLVCSSAPCPCLRGPERLLPGLEFLLKGSRARLVLVVVVACRLPALVFRRNLSWL
jgi:hypothetical protein